MNNPMSLAGRVVIEFTIGTDGKVSGSRRGDGTDLADGEASQCMAEAVSHWTFPEPEQGVVQVRYPFVLSPG